jgi:hypothetical protein
MNTTNASISGFTPIGHLPDGQRTSTGILTQNDSFEP